MTWQRIERAAGGWRHYARMTDDGHELHARGYVRPAPNGLWRWYLLEHDSRAVIASGTAQYRSCLGLEEVLGECENGAAWAMRRRAA